LPQVRSFRTRARIALEEAGFEITHLFGSSRLARLYLPGVCPFTSNWLCSRSGNVNPRRIQKITRVAMIGLARRSIGKTQPDGVLASHSDVVAQRHLKFPLFY
jgi:hypothetical protein